MAKSKTTAKKKAGKPRPKKKADDVKEVSIPVPEREKDEAEKFAESIHKKFDKRAKEKNSDLSLYKDPDEAMKAVKKFLTEWDKVMQFTIELHSTADRKINVHTSFHAPV